jgi:hypothetical protein
MEAFDKISEGLKEAIYLASEDFTFCPPNYAWYAIWAADDGLIHGKWCMPYVYWGA